MNVPYPKNYFTPEDDKPEMIEKTNEELAEEFAADIRLKAEARFKGKPVYKNLNRDDSKDKLAVIELIYIQMELLETISELYFEKLEAQK